MIKNFILIILLFNASVLLFSCEETADDYINDIKDTERLCELDDFLQQSTSFQSDKNVQIAVEQQRKYLSNQRYVQFNITLLLDLSNRISKELNPNQDEKDIATFKVLADFLSKQAKEKQFMYTKDKINVQVAYQQGQENVFRTFADKAMIDLEPYSRDLSGQTLTINQLNDAQSNFMKSCESLYNEAQRNTNYTGADIWHFFKYNLDKKYIQNSNCTDSIRNILIVLTDGYVIVEGSNKGNCVDKQCPFMSNDQLNDIRNKQANWKSYFESNQFGLLPIQKPEFKNLEVLVLELNPTKNLFVNGKKASNTFSYEYEVLHRFWDDWLKGMGLKQYQIAQTEDASENTKNVISNFLGQSIGTSPPVVTNPPPQPIVIPELQGSYTGKLNDNLRQLNLKINDKPSEFLYTINGLGDKEKNKKGTIDLEKQTISFETLGEGLLSQKDGKYTITSKENKWTFTKQNN